MAAKKIKGLAATMAMALQATYSFWTHKGNVVRRRQHSGTSHEVTSLTELQAYQISLGRCSQAPYSLFLKWRAFFFEECCIQAEGNQATNPRFQSPLGCSQATLINSLQAYSRSLFPFLIAIRYRALGMAA